MQNRGNDGQLFIERFIPKVSRTFALAIKFLPENLRHPVYCAYLLCRVADTIEDSRQISSEEKAGRLLKLNEILREASNGAKIAESHIESLYDGIDPSEGHDHLLLGSAPELFAVMADLPDAQQSIIYRWAGEMAGGMAEYSHLGQAAGSSVASLKDISDWDRYCHFVAGTVGFMLTELFAAELKIGSGRKEELLQLCNSFGLGLQKVNTIKDVPDDRRRKVVFLPLEIMKKYQLTPDMLANSEYAGQISGFVFELVRISVRHLDDAISYTLLFPENEIGIRMFLCVPVLLAIETVSLIGRHPVRAMTGPPIKISRPDVLRLTAAAGLYSGSNSKLTEYYEQLKTSMETQEIDRGPQS